MSTSIRTCRNVILAAAMATLMTQAIGAGPAMAETGRPLVPEIKWNTPLKHFQVDSDKFIGQRFTFKCPPRSVRDTDGAIYGTGVYPSDNPLCVAALHAGAVTKNGGLVTVQLNPGRDQYAGSERNGIKSGDLPGTQRSLVFIQGTNGAADKIRTDYIPRLGWDDKFTRTGLANRELVGQRFAFNCPAAPATLSPRRVVGTDVYAFDSMICRAAVHAGKITTGGGRVIVQLNPARKTLVGSIRHGIETKSGSSGVRSLTFVDGY